MLGSINTLGRAARGISSGGGNNTTTMSGSITTTGNDAIAIYADGGSNTTTMSGSIKTTGDLSFGIYTYGGNNTTTMSGSISTTGDGSDGINADGGSNTTTMSGSISTSGDQSHGIYNWDDNNTTNMSGSITTSGDGSDGINASGGSNTTTTSGSISTTGDGSDGINASGGSNTTTTSGSIKTTGDGSDGINASGGSNTTTMSGSISTTGDGSEGIYASGGSNTTTMSGSISTTGDGSHGIYVSGGSNTTTMSGSISTNGLRSYGIYTYGDNITTNMSGSITTSGDISYGILQYGDNGTINMSGSISSASDTYARGIYINGDNNTTTMSGSISAAGTDAYAMRHLGDDNTTTISGSVTSTGTASSALMNTSGSGGTFILDEGAVIIGDITALAAATNNKLKFNLGEDTSYAFTVGGGGAGTGAGQWTFTDQDGRTPIATTSGTNCASTGVTVCNLVTAVSSGNATEHNELQFAMNSSMIGSFQPSQSNSWANLYGDTSKRHASTTKLAFDTQNTGLTIGTPLAISKNINLDLVFNASNTNLDIGSAKEQEITAKSINVGAIIRDLFPSNTWLVDAFGFVGRNTYDGKRKVMNNNIATGSETVTAAYSGNEILLGLDAQYSQAINNTFNFTGGINANLSNEKIEAYSESKYYSWDARTMLQAAGGINLGLEYNKDALTTFASLGLQHSSLQKGKTATYTNNGTAGSFIDKATSDTRRSATVGFSYKASENIAFKGAVEAFTSENGVDGNSANLRINWAF
jgi:hypothetical protein